MKTILEPLNPGDLDPGRVNTVQDPEAHTDWKQVRIVGGEEGEP
jgi:hypothetical protein